MKSILLLIAAGCAPLIAGAQVDTPINSAGPATAPAVAPESPTAASPTPAGLPVPPGPPGPPVPPRPAAPASSPSGSTHDAAATVPLPGQPAGATLERNIPLITEPVPSNERGSSHSHRAQPGASPAEFATFSTEKDIRMRIRIRQAETRVLNEPGIQAEWAAAHAVSTDPERRRLLTVYYNDLFDRMIKADPTIAEHVNLRRGNVLARMKYPRLGDEDNSEDPFVPPAAEASGVNPPAADTVQ